MMPEVPLPPLLRRFQQSWYWQSLLLPFLVGFGGSLLLQGCLGDLGNLQQKCIWAAFNGYLISLITSWIKGHSLGSASFAADGTKIAAVGQLKQLVDTAHSVQAKAADPSAPEVTDEDAATARTALGNAARSIAAQVELV